MRQSSDVKEQELESFTGLACIFFADEDLLDAGVIRSINLKTGEEEVGVSCSFAS